MLGSFTTILYSSTGLLFLTKSHSSGLQQFIRLVVLRVVMQSLTVPLFLAAFAAHLYTHE